MTVVVSLVGGIGGLVTVGAVLAVMLTWYGRSGSLLAAGLVVLTGLAGFYVARLCYDVVVYRQVWRTVGWHRTLWLATMGLVVILGRVALLGLVA